MENATPEQLAFIVLMAVSVLLVQTAWAWRAQLLDAWRRALPRRHRVSTIPVWRPRDYVTRDATEDHRSAPFPQEPEREREPERGGNDLPTTPRVDGTLYTSEQLERRDRRSRDAGAAEALGLVLAWGLLPEDRRTAAMEAIYGPRGRRWQETKPLIEAASARFAPPAPVELKPMSGAPRPPGVVYAGEVADASAELAGQP